MTVSELNENIKTFLEEAFGTFWVEGEVSNLRRPQSGHTYFTLKDDKSQVRAVYFRTYGARSVRFDLEDGLKVLCRARLSAYLPRGEYQLIVESVEPRGTGALQKAFEQLKARLAAEGLFDAARKKPLPFLPRRIGVITSPTGAVIRDILNITRRRFPSVDILLAPTRVQGAEAAGEIIAALRRLEASGNVDLILIARGGGSLEDLAPFNDEALARAVNRCGIPVVSAVGHETDFTICDFVADLRAPTPSAAAELALPQRDELLADLGRLRQRLISAQRRYLTERKSRLTALQSHFKDPRRFLEDQAIYLDDLRERLRLSLSHKTQIEAKRVQHLALVLHHRNPERLAEEKRMILGNLEKSFLSRWRVYLKDRQERLNHNSALLSSLNPLAVLQRGYSITRTLPELDIVRHAARVAVHQNLRIELARGVLEARVEKIQGE